MELIEGKKHLSAKEALEQAEVEYQKLRRSEEMANRLAKEAQAMGEGQTLQSAHSAVQEVLKGELAEMRRMQSEYSNK